MPLGKTLDAVHQFRAEKLRRSLIRAAKNQNRHEFVHALSRAHSLIPVAPPDGGGIVATECLQVMVQIAPLKMADGATVLVFQVPPRSLRRLDAEAHADQLLARLRATIHKNLRNNPMVLIEGGLDELEVPPVYGPAALRGPVGKAWARRLLQDLKWSRLEVPGL